MNATCYKLLASSDANISCRVYSAGYVPPFSLGSVKETRGETDDIAPAWLPWSLAAAFAVACAVVWNQGNAVKTQSGTMRRQLDELNLRSAQLNRDASDMQRQLALLQTELKELRDKDWLARLQIAMLSSALKESQAVAVSLWNQEKQEGVFAVERLGLLPADKDYQLWVIDSNNPNPVDAGVFSVVDEKGRVVYKFTPKASVQKAAKFAVSIEKKGGAEKPTVDQIVLIGG